MSVINDVPAWVTSRRQPSLAIHLFVGQETVISLERQEKSWSPNCHISKHKNYKSSSPPFLAVELNHSQVFASDLEKSQFTMENLKNNFGAQISKVLGREIALTHRQDIKSVSILYCTEMAGCYVGLPWLPVFVKIVSASLPAYFHCNAGS